MVTPGQGGGSANPVPVGIQQALRPGRPCAGSGRACGARPPRRSGPGSSVCTSSLGVGVQQVMNRKTPGRLLGEEGGRRELVEQPACVGRVQSRTGTRRRRARSPARGVARSTGTAWPDRRRAPGTTTTGRRAGRWQRRSRRTDRADAVRHVTGPPVAAGCRSRWVARPATTTSASGSRAQACTRSRTSRPVGGRKRVAEAGRHEVLGLVRVEHPQRQRAGPRSTR